MGRPKKVGDRVVVAEAAPKDIKTILYGEVGEIIEIDKIYVVVKFPTLRLTAYRNEVRHAR